MTLLIISKALSIEPLSTDKQRKDNAWTKRKISESNTRIPSVFFYVPH